MAPMPLAPTQAMRSRTCADVIQPCRRHIGLLFGERLNTLLTSSNQKNLDSPVHTLSDSLRIYFFHSGPVHTLSDSLRIYFFHSGERIYFFPDSLSNSADTCGR